RDIADVAEKLRPPAIRRDVDLLADVRAVELERVKASSALDGVAAVARFPHECVAAVPERGGVVSAAAGDEIVARAADQRIGAVAAGDGVGAVAPVEGKADEA